MSGGPPARPHAPANRTHMAGPCAAGERPRPAAAPHRGGAAASVSAALQKRLPSVSGRWWCLAPAALLALPCLLAILVGGFDGLYGQDAYAYLAYSVGPLRESLLRLQPPPPFYWPPGYPLAVAFVSLVLGPIARAGQLVSLAAGLAAAALTALLAREVWPERPRVAALAGLLVALSPQLWQSSIAAMSDTTALAAATLGAWALVRYDRRGSGLALIAAAGGLGWAIVSRWIFGLVAIPFALHALVVLWRRGAAVALPTLGAALVGGAIVLPVLLAALLGLGSPNAPFATDLQVYSWSPANALARRFVTVDGLLSYRLPNGLYYFLAPGSPLLVGPLAAALAIPGLWSSRRASAGVWLLIAWIAMVLVFHAGAPWQNIRFVLAVLPPVAILSGRGADAMLESRRAAVRRGATVLLAASVLVQVIVGVGSMRGFLQRKDAELELVRWATAQIPPGATLLTFGPTLAFQHYSSLPTADLSEQDASTLTKLAQRARPLFVLADEGSLATQWQGRAPALSLEWLQRHRALHPVAQRAPYTLLEASLR